MNSSLRADRFGLGTDIIEDTLALNETVRQGISGKVVKHAVELLGDRDILVGAIGTTAPNLSRYCNMNFPYQPVISTII